VNCLLRILEKSVVHWREREREGDSLMRLIAVMDWMISRCVLDAVKRDRERRCAVR